MSSHIPSVLRLTDVDFQLIKKGLLTFQLNLIAVEANQPIEGSFWGDEEAGLMGNNLYARADTPLHSICHEAGHYICMDANRRRALDTNAEGDYDEENAVCFLQILLGEHLGVSRQKMFADMDAWGYSFRLGSSQTWFEQDAEEAKAWLLAANLINKQGELTGNLHQ
jgi:hypothetical protein